MCWSGEASAVLAAVGISSAAYLAVKKDPEPMALWISLLYFSSMEALQAVSYTVVDQCDSPLNQTLTLLGFLHIAFQPFFINAMALYFMPTDAARQIAPWAYSACFVATIAILIQLYPFNWAGHCIQSWAVPACGDVLCTVRGEWHIAWLVPINGIGSRIAPGFLPYQLAAFLMPILIGSWRFTLFTMLAGPLLASLTTSNMNEFPAVWCLFSIGLVLAIIKTPLRYNLHVSDPWWVIFRKWWARRNAPVTPSQMSKSY